MTTPPPPFPPPFEPSDPAIFLALRNAAVRSPCAKSKRGVVVFDAITGRIFGGVYNAPALGRCGGDAACRAACSKICIHAEEMAILALGSQGALKHPRDLEVAHLKVVDGEPAPSGPPSCVECSKLMLTAGIAAVWLLHESPEGAPPQWRRYEVGDFHRRTLAHLGLPVTEDGPELAPA